MYHNDYLFCCQHINSEDGAKDDVDGRKSKPSKNNQSSSQNFQIFQKRLRRLGILIIPPCEYYFLLHLSHFLFDEINDCVKSDLKERHEQVPEEPDFNELDVGSLGEGVRGGDEEICQHEEGGQICHVNGVVPSFLCVLLVLYFCVLHLHFT